MIKFPYAISNFQLIQTEGYYYVDRTDRIPLIEEAGYQLLWLRPRRFGKTLLLSMLENYYDLARADQFAAIFGKLAIGKNPTPWHNRYFVMKWDFSVIRQWYAERLRELLLPAVVDQEAAQEQVRFFLRTGNLQPLEEV